MQNKSNISRKKAFTLIEILVAAVILGTVAISVLMAFINCMILNEVNRDKAQAMTHIQYALEDMNEENAASDLLTLQANINSGFWNWTDFDINGEGLVALDGETVVTTASWEVVNELLNVAVEANWEDRRGRPMSVELRTLFAEFLN